MATELHGALIDEGAQDWQVFQRLPDGTGEIPLRGRWRHAEPGNVQVRIVEQDTGSAVLDWRNADTRPDGTWSACIGGIPPGGLYRLETRYRAAKCLEGEWSQRGDMRHFLGVGDIWVIAGQSNSAGYGRGPYNDPPEMGVHLFRNSEQWALATHPMNESTGSRHLCNAENGNPAHSPYLHFGRVLKRALGVPIGLVQTSLGGSPLSRWNPAEPGPSDLYENMIHCIEAVGGRVTGILWYQGESDTNTDQAANTHTDRFIAAVHAWRERLRAPNLRVLTVQLNRFHAAANPEADKRWSIVRDSQRLVPGRVSGVAVVPTLDLSMADTIHTGCGGNLLLGERLARVALDPVRHAAPDIQSARRTDQGIELRFAPVVSRMDTIDPTAVPFRVQDSDGVVTVQKVVYPKNDTIQLVLDRPLKGDAVIHAGYGLNPPILPMDIERQMPILAFHGVKVE